MNADGFIPVLLLGMGGGFAAEALKWYALRESPSFPDYAKRPFYWLVTLVMMVMGGGLAALYGIHDVNGLQAVNVGASAPLVVRALAAGATNESSAMRGGPRPGAQLIDFLAGR